MDFSGATSYGSSSYYFIVNDMVVPMRSIPLALAPEAGTGVRSGMASTAGIRTTCSRPAWSSMPTAPAATPRSPYYSAWYEWYPYGEVRISSLPVAAGDDIFVEVWHTSSTQGYAYLVNEQQPVVEVGFTASPGIPWSAIRLSGWSSAPLSAASPP